MVAESSIEHRAHRRPKQQAETGSRLHVADVLELFVTTSLRNGRDHGSLREGITVSLNKSGKKGEHQEGLPVLVGYESKQAESHGANEDAEEAEQNCILPAHHVDSNGVNLRKDDGGYLEGGQTQGNHGLIDVVSVVVGNEQRKEGYYVVVLGTTGYLPQEHGHEELELSSLAHVAVLGLGLGGLYGSIF